MRMLTASFLAVFSAAAAAMMSPAPASAAPNACTLVTTAEASAAMGVASLPGKARPTRHGTSCRWYSPDHKMNVFVQTIGPGDMISAGQAGGKAVPGIGDRAVWAYGSLFVQKGGNYAQIALYLKPASMEKMDPAVIPLAKTAAGRM
jgi:hypothetical protein